MKPKEQVETGAMDLFQSRLDQILNTKHPLYRLSGEINWSYFEKSFGALYVPGKGRPGLPTRLLVGLHYLKHTYNVSDENVVEGFLENPYWQYFCGYEFFQHTLPLDPTSLVKWRKRIGKDGIEKLLKETIELGKRSKQIKANHGKRVNVDTTVQEKAISYPTDAKLYHHMREKLVKSAQEQGVELRQSYKRLSKQSLVMQGRYRHARQMKRANRELRKLKTYLGRVVRDIERKSEGLEDEQLGQKLSLANRLLLQQRDSKNKIYSLHAPEVECIGKGKVHKKYEFGCKVSVVTTSKGNWVLGVQALHGNPYDGHTLEGALAQAKTLSGFTPQEAYCDKGYRGIKMIDDTKVILPKRAQKSESRSKRFWRKRRSAIEPIIGHLKADHRMNRNHYLGRAGDQINAILSGCGFNLKKVMHSFFLLKLKWRIFVKKFALGIKSSNIFLPLTS